jgi:hypothetical protein
MRIASCTSISPYLFMAPCLIKHRDNFTFPFYADIITKGFSEWDLYFVPCSVARLIQYAFIPKGNFIS